MRGTHTGLDYRATLSQLTCFPPMTSQRDPAVSVRPTGSSGLAHAF